MDKKKSGDSKPMKFGMEEYITDAQSPAPSKTMSTPTKPRVVNVKPGMEDYALDASPATSTSAPVKKQSFKEAFAANRKAGKSEFEWGGKKFNTKLASDIPKAPTKTTPKPTPVVSKASESIESQIQRAEANGRYQESLERAKTPRGNAAKASELASKNPPKQTQLKPTGRVYNPVEPTKPYKKDAPGGFKLKTKNTSKR